MNLQNFREILKTIGERYWPKKKVHEAPAFFWRCDQVTYDILDRIGRDHVDRYVCHSWYHMELARPANAPIDPSRRGSVQRLPFDCFILRTDDEASGEHTWRLIVDTPVAPFPDDVCWGLMDGQDASLVAIAVYEAGSMRFDAWDTARRRIVTDEGSRVFLASLLAEAHEWLETLGREPAKLDLKLILAWRRYQAVNLRPFLFELFHPGNHVVKVAPSAVGRSVQWREGRSHYLVLDRKSMAHVLPSAGKISAEAKAEAIRRAAHFRRAHIRTLRHSKWGKRAGELVDVHSAWIGPREWEGPDGKTYVVLDKKPGVST